MALYRNACFVFAALAAVAVVNVDGADVLNKFYVKYSLLKLGDLLGFYEMPRTTTDAAKDKYAVATSSSSAEPYSTWCRDKDHRVCVLFDQKGSVCGLQVSVAAADINNTVPLNLDSEVQLERKTVLGVDVYSAVAFFVPQELLHLGGRTIDNNTATATGLYIRQRPNSILHIPLEESSATSLGFTKQGCFYGMGRHYFYGASPTQSCSAIRPHFLVYGEKSHTLQAYGFQLFGKKTQSQRSWFETVPAFMPKVLAPTGPQCVTDWTQKYGMFTLHVYFIEKPWFITC